jgi:hypothetical protein
VCSTFCEEDDNPYLTSYQPRSFCVPANARKGMRDEQYLLSRVVEALNIGEHGEVLEAAPAPQQLEDGLNSLLMNWLRLTSELSMIHDLYL